MTHIDLINKIYTHKRDIDEVYKSDRDREFFIGVDEKLFEFGILKSFGKRVILNKDYRNFVDFSLNRANIFKRFDNYSKDLDALKESKKEFLITKKEFFKIATLQIIEDIYDKISTQDREIKKLVSDISIELSFDIDILISQSQRALRELKTLIEAMAKIQITFNEVIIGDDIEIDSLSKELLYNLEIYIENIDRYCRTLSQIIVMNKAKKAQNRKLKKLAKMIIEDRLEPLNRYVEDNSSEVVISTNIKPQSYIALDSDREILKVAKKVEDNLELNIKKERVKKTEKFEMKHEVAIFIDLDKILQDLIEVGAKDLYMFIKNHSEIVNYSKEIELNGSDLVEEIFVSFLTLVIPKSENLYFRDSYNEENIKVVEWKNR